jgi:hypothetical protein
LIDRLVKLIRWAAAQRADAIMPLCEVHPNGPCPQHLNDKTVVTGNDYILLCQSCNTERRRLFDETKKLNEAKLCTVKQAASVADDISKKSKLTRSVSVRSVSTSSLAEQLG